MTGDAARVRERCGECGFDAASWNRGSAPGVLAGISTEWRQVFSGSSDDELRRRPLPAVWSPLEYTVHTTLVVRWWNEALRALADGRPVTVDFERYPDADVFPFNEASTQDALDDLDHELGQLVEFAAGASEETLMLPIRVTQEPIERAFNAEGIVDLLDGVLHALHDALHHLGDIRAAVAPPR